MVASPKTMNAVNKFYNVLTEIFEGLVPDEDFNANVPPTMSPVFREVEERDIPAQIGRFEKARILLLWSMREDLGYSKKDLLKARA